MKHYCTGIRNAAPNDCCHQHDRDYGIHGTVSRAQADRRFRDCVCASGHPVRAWLLWAVLRLVGWAWYRKKVRAE